MPSSTEPPRPAFGQVWRWAGTASDLILICPTSLHGAWNVIFIGYNLSGTLVPSSHPYNIVKMYGLYRDRAPIEGYTYLGDAE